MTIFNAFIGSVIVLMVVSIFTGNSTGIDNSSLTNYIFQVINELGGSAKFPDVIYLLFVKKKNTQKTRETNRKQ